MNMVTAPRNLRADAVRNIKRIVAAAQRVFARAGADAAMDDVATEAGVGIATVYRRFPTKESLLRVVLYRRFDEVVEAALRRGPHEPAPPPAVRAALRRDLAVPPPYCPTPGGGGPQRDHSD